MNKLIINTFLTAMRYGLWGRVLLCLGVLAIGNTGVYAAKVDLGGLGSGPIAETDIPHDEASGTKGMFGPAVHWPSIPIHLTLLPDGKVLTFGAGIIDANTMSHSIWDPALGTLDSAHHTVADPIGSDVFCAGQTVIPSTGQTFVAGGTAIIKKKFNYSVATTHFLDNATGDLKLDASMAFKRWYPSLLTLSDERVLILGGRDEKDTPTFASTPEIYQPGVGFKILTGATNEDAYGKNYHSWNYPKAFLAPNGKVFIVAPSGKTFYLDPDGNDGSGQIEPLATKTVEAPSFLPSVMYEPGKILSLRTSKPVANKAQIINLNTPSITLEDVNPPSQLRYYASTTLLADGKVLLSGGSSVRNKEQGVALHVETWDPATKAWTTGASAQKIRLYHSNALLLPDATVLTGGGGRGAPTDHLNAEIYYPPYLYQADGSPATPRPKITTAPDQLTWDNSFNVKYSSANPISRVTFVRFGSATHNLNLDQRFMELAFVQKDDNTLRVTGPTHKTMAPPGYYMLFIFDQNGVPSVAKIIKLT